MYVVMVGGGTLATTLAKHLVGEGHEVVIIEEDERRAKELTETLDVLVIHGDGSDSEVLKDAEVERADAVVALTRDDNTNLTICQLAKKFEVGRIIARVNDPLKEDLFLSLGVTAINPISAMVSHFKNAILQREGERSLVSVEKGEAEILELTLENEKFDGKAIRDIDLPKDALIGMVCRGGEVEIPRPDSVVRKGDLLVVLAKSKAVKDVVTLLRGS